MLERLNRWVVHWAETRHAGIALFLLAFAESSCFPVPPDLLLIALVLAKRDAWIKWSLICLAGSVIGGMAGYAIGWGVWRIVSSWFFQYVFSEAAFHHVQVLYQRYDFWTVFAAGFTPIPYKVFTIAGGVARINFATFVLVSSLSRGGRFFVVAILVHVFGVKAKPFIKKHFGWLSIVFVILLIGGFFAIKYILH